MASRERGNSPATLLAAESPAQMNANPRHQSTDGLAGMRLLSLREHRVSGSAADAKILPEPEPWTRGKRFIMPSIRGRDIAFAEWPDIRGLEHFLKLPDIVNDAFNIHSEQYSELGLRPAAPTRIHSAFTALNHQTQEETSLSALLALEKYSWWERQGIKYGKTPGCCKESIFWVPAELLSGRHLLGRL